MKQICNQIEIKSVLNNIVLIKKCGINDNENYLVDLEDNFLLDLEDNFLLSND